MASGAPSLTMLSGAVDALCTNAYTLSLLSLKAAEIRQTNPHQGDGSSARGAAGTNWAVVLHYFRQVGPHHLTSIPWRTGTVTGRQCSGGRGPMQSPGPLTPPSKAKGKRGGSAREDF